MKKILFTLCFALTFIASQAQPWDINLNHGSTLKLGTSGNDPLNFFTNNTKVMTLSETGTLKLDSLSGSGYGLLYVDAGGTLARFPGYVPGRPCDLTAFPWALGGNEYPPDNTIGTCTNDDFILKSNGQKSVFLKTNGYVGIGLNNSSPSAPVDLFDGINTGNTDHLKFYPDASGSIETTNEMNLNYANSTAFTINEGSVSGGTTQKFSISGSWSYLFTGLTVSGGLGAGGNVTANGKFQSTSATSTDEAVKVINSGTSKTNFLVYNSGKTIIGDSQQVSPSAHTGAMLSVHGKIVGKELILTQANWADYVFNPSYKLRSLDGLERYISQNKHLPNVPSAAEIEKDGINVAEINKIQMEKIEELTLYVIALKKEIDAIKKEIKKQ